MLLVAIIAAIALTHSDPQGIEAPGPGAQVKVRREDRVRMVSMPSENRE